MSPGLPGLVVWLLGIILVTTPGTKAPAGSQQDIDAVIAAEEAMMVAYNAGDADKILARFAPDVDGFDPFGRLLQEGIAKADLISAYKAGFKPNIRTRERQVTIYGDVAVSTSYTDGSIRAGEEVITGPWRSTNVWRKKSDGWRIVHYHSSPLRTLVMKK